MLRHDHWKQNMMTINYSFRKCFEDVWKKKILRSTDINSKISQIEESVKIFIMQALTESKSWYQKSKEKVFILVTDNTFKGCKVEL